MKHMGKYNAVAVIYGSDTSESELSCRSGEYVASRLDDSLYDVYEIFARFGVWSLAAFRKKNSVRVTFPQEARPEIDKNDFSVMVFGEKVKLDYAFIVQHGFPGETGQLQGYFEMLSIPFSTSSSFVSSVVFDKYSCKCCLKDAGFVSLAPEVFVRKGDDISMVCSKVADTMTFPVFVKPTAGGSSFGVTKVKDLEELNSAINFAFTEGDTVIVEQAICGQEFTCGVYSDGKNVIALPEVEIITDCEFFDYDAKYNGASQEICPAQIPSALSDEIRRTSEKIFSYLGCAGFVRMDFIYSGEKLYFLEVNNVPGMTSASIIPKMVRAAGLDITAFLSTIIESK